VGPRAGLDAKPNKQTNIHTAVRMKAFLGYKHFFWIIVIYFRSSSSGTVKSELRVRGS
jgi:hypothetical protein